MQACVKEVCGELMCFARLRLQILSACHENPQSLLPLRALSLANMSRAFVR